jgi:protease-4
VIEKLEGKKMVLITPDSMQSYHRPYDRRWSEEKRIALIYAIGICAMDAGIKARSLQHDIDAAAGDPAIQAVVIRVDSPGGDALASDLVAEAIARCRKEKPVVISQGIVAASGGYWLSMNGDVICAGPQTMTGSIGVAAGWMYDNGLKGKLGIATDFVKKGEHADFGFGFSLPYLFIGLPDRNINDDERHMLEDTMRFIYRSFVGKVAEGRGKNSDAIEEIAQGRIWSGLKAKEIGLVDEIGGLSKAVAIAKEKAGVPLDEQVTIVELPEIDFFRLYTPFLSFLGIKAKPEKVCSPPYDGVASFDLPAPFDVRWPLDPLFNYLRFRVDNNGKAMPILDFDMMDMLRGR